MGMAFTMTDSAGMADLIHADRINGRLYCDDAIFRREIEQIWNKVWVYVGHDSEVARPGDYIRRPIGTQPVVMLRGQDNAVRVFFNRCRHRGNLICHLDRGHAETLRCPYHGWTFSTEGTLLAPTFDDAYDEDLHSSDFGLTPVPRMASYRGLVFASLSPYGISLDEHLGAVKPFLDMIFDRSPTGELELSAGVQKTRFRGNWKMLAENSLEGGYHGFFIHKFAFDLFDRHNDRDRMNFHDDATWYLPGGHMVEDFRSVHMNPPQTEARKAYAAMLVERYGTERAKDLVPGKAPITFVFPNLMFVQTHFRRLQPMSVDETFVYYQPAMIKGVPEEINRDLLRQHEAAFGPAGFLAPDDLEILERTQVGLQAEGNEWLFIGRGIHREKHLEGGVSTGFSMDEKPHPRHVASLCAGHGGNGLTAGDVGEPQVTR